EEVIMAIYSKKHDYGVSLRVDTRQIAATSRLVSRITGVPVPSHKAIVGANAFMHASGIHQDGVLKERDTYEIINPDVVGIPSNMIVLSARSGRHALRHRLEEIGYRLEGEQLEDVYRRFLALADSKGEVFDEDLHALMGAPGTEGNDLVLRDLSVTTNGAAPASATVTLEVRGRTLTDAACGNGPIDALFKAIDRIVGCEVQLEDYSLKSVSQGTRALGDATVKLRCETRLVVGRGISTDIFEASARAYVNALAKAQRLTA
ncbi:MAG: alpha-isopropylmalate synthase regulatory domain-containing protein, partial [Syntrophomonadaceae bacterium]|nr:alpha-isopropylmalate synthase regulatory domain-containing protein [Syntrophomonadaceae bacterium]